MKKTFLIVGIVLPLFIALFAYLVFRDNRSAPTTGSRVVPETEQETSEGGGFSLWTEPVSIQDVSLQEAVGDPLEDVDVSSLGKTYGDDAGKVAEVVAGEEGLGFLINYYEADRSVSILLTQAPFQETRIRAEKAFLEKFGVTKAAACLMDIRLSVFAHYDMTDYGLSFCPDGKSIPEE